MRGLPIRTSAGLSASWAGSSSSDGVENSPVWSRSIPLRGLEPTSLGPWYPVSLRLVAAYWLRLWINYRRRIYISQYRRRYIFSRP